MRILRFDDISINSDMSHVEHLIEIAAETFDYFWLCVSPAVFDMSIHNHPTRERVFPKILNAYSDFTRFFKVDKIGIPKLPFGKDIEAVSHGLVHVDHRLLAKEAQELSIVMSCSLVKTRRFVPPFNKWNQDTEEICSKHGIELVKFEDGWRCVEYEKFDLSTNTIWYLHDRNITAKQFQKWIGI